MAPQPWWWWLATASGQPQRQQFLGTFGVFFGSFAPSPASSLGKSGGLPTLGVESLQDRGDEGREDEGSEVEGCNSRGGSLGKGWGSTGGALLLPLDVGLWRAGALFALGGV